MQNRGMINNQAWFFKIEKAAVRSSNGGFYFFNIHNLYHIYNIVTNVTKQPIFFQLHVLKPNT